MKSFNLISSIVSRQWPASRDFWEAWGIQLLLTMSLTCQITLVILGSRRRYMTSNITRYVIQTAYLLSSYLATIALGKLTFVQIDNPDRPDYITELKGSLAPLLLMQLGNPDSITAYSVEDNRLSGRQMLSLSVKVIFVIWILIRCWDSSPPVPLMYIFLSVAGIIRSAETVWALALVYWKRSGASAKDIFDEETVGKFFDKQAPWPMDQEIILKAYYRYDCLKPHIVNWLYRPKSLKESQLTVGRDVAFITTEVELGFMYDVLYTKQPILYKRLGLIRRFTSFSCLVSALCGFAINFKSAFMIDMYITYTYALLIGVTTLEGYQLVQQPFSAWAIVEMSRHQRNWPRLTRPLNFLVEKYMKRKRWSNSIGQLDLLDHRLNDEWPWSIGRILKHLGKKEVTLRRHEKPFTKRGEWTLEAHKLSGDVEGTQELEVLEKNISTTFDRSITIWHMATNICLLSERADSPYCKGSKLLSNYMIYLLALRPYTLSLTTTDITLEHACAMLKLFLRYRDRNVALGTLSSEEKVLEPSLDDIVKEWHVLRDAQELAAMLKDKNYKWQIISSIWVEMLCHAAYRCQVYHHENLLRQGGELITHVWLLLMHHTDKYKPLSKTKPTKETEGKSQDEL
ncbi:uncharacterized protein LOC104439142 [Eucalyptus grandis]|uniref:uncharacterized protein LOC104439142 n=1 Tax=Eucalyptus grandis TaxID=71139 RepID=UPI00192E8712|nr:uncharacterized protein LOC104439142 [Eucalyptus grandis]